MYLFPEEVDQKLLSGLEKLEPLALALAAVTCAGSLLIAGVPALAHHAGGWWADMQPTTALALLFAVLVLVFTGARRAQLLQTVGTAIALGLVLTAVAGLIAHLDFLPGSSWRIPVLPPIPTAIASLLCFLGLLFNRQSAGPRSILADGGAVVTVAFLLFLVGGFVFDTFPIMGAGRASLQSPSTVLVVGLLGVVLIMRRAMAGGAFRFIVAAGVGSRIARAVLPAIVATPFVVFQAINVLDSMGVLPSVRSQALAAPLLVMATIAIVVWMGSYTNAIEGRLRGQSFTDQLTGVLNRRGFESASTRLARTELSQGCGAIAFYFDLDNLKRANDVLGHTAGSQVIQRFADLLSVSFRKSDIIGRVGGDEFVVLTPAPIESAEEILARFARVVEQLNSSDYVPMPISYSVGYAELPAGSSGDLDALVAEADARMYTAKSLKRAA